MNPDLTPPTTREIRAARRLFGHTQPQAAAIVGAGFRTWQHWEAPENSKDHHNMPRVKFDYYLRVSSKLAKAEAYNKDVLDATRIEQLEKVMSQGIVDQLTHLMLQDTKVHKIKTLLCELYQVLNSLGANDKVLEQVSAAIDDTVLPYSTILMPGNV